MAVKLTVAAPASVGISVATVSILRVDNEPYAGSYSVTPTQETQTLATNGLHMTADVTVNPIPSNYGLITHNGFGIMIS